MGNRTFPKIKKEEFMDQNIARNLEGEALALWVATNYFEMSDKELRINLKMKIAKRNFWGRIFQGYDGKRLRFLEKAVFLLDEARIRILMKRMKEARELLDKYHDEKVYFGLAGPVCPL
jgi:hypothetical protein